jgi:hypothetical protein
LIREEACCLKSFVVGGCKEFDKVEVQYSVLCVAADVSISMEIR